MADRSIVYRLEAEISQFQARMAQASASVRKFADDATGATRSGRDFRAGLDTVGSAAGKVGLVAAAGLGFAVKKAADFDSAMSSVAATGEDARANMAALRDAAIEAGEATAFSATESAAGIENLLKAGVSAKDVMGGGLAGALDLAAAGTMEVGAAAEVAATAMTQFKLSGKDVPHVADLLAAGAGKAQGEVHDLGMALGQSGLVAAQMGLSIEETTGTLSAFASAGLLGSDAGTSLKTMLLRLANPSKEAADLMAEFGIQAYDATGKLVPMANLAQQLQEGFKGQSQATRDAAMATMFGSDAIRAANVLYNQGSAGIRQWTKDVNDQGYAAEVAATKLDNLKGDLEELGGAFETALIGTGSGSQGIARSAVQSLTELIRSYNDLSPAAQSATAKGLAVTAMLGGTVLAASQAVQGIAATREAMTQLGLATDAASMRLRVARAGLGAAGLGLLAFASSAGETSDELGTLSGAIGGAMAGFAVGGPWGAALGAAAGGIYGLTREAKTNAEAAAELRGPWQDYASTLDEVTGAVTSATRAMALERAEKSGLLKQTQMMGIEDRVAVQAMTGNVKARIKVVDGIKAEQAAIERRRAAIMADARSERPQIAGWKAREMLDELDKQESALKGTYEALGEVARAQDEAARKAYTTADGFRASTEAAIRVGRTTGDWSKALRGLPSNVKVALENVNFKPTLAQVEELTRKYKLTPREVRTLAMMVGGPKAMAEAEALIAKMREADKTTARPKVTVDTGDSVSRIQAIRNMLSGVESKTVYLTTVTKALSVESRVPARTSAAGNLWDRADMHAPEMASGRTLRVWAEPETQGETYIPHANDWRRPRAKALLSETASMFGGRVEWYAAGAVKSGKKRVASSYGDPGDALARQLAEQLAAREVRESQLLAAREEAQRVQENRDRATADLSEEIARLNAETAQNAARLQEEQAAAAKRYQEEEQSAFNDAFGRILDDGLRATEKELQAATSLYETAKATKTAFSEAVSKSWDNPIFGKGLAAAKLQLQADANDSATMRDLLTKAVGAGLDGAAFEAVAKSQDLTTLRELVAGGAAEIAAFEALYAGRANAQNSLGMYAAEAAYPQAAIDALGSAAAGLQAQVDQLSAAVRDLGRAAPEFQAAVEAGAAAGTEAGMARLDQLTGARARAGR